MLRPKGFSNKSCSYEVNIKNSENWSRKRVFYGAETGDEKHGELAEGTE